ncbi:MAG TPA: hypothetical protein VHY78_09765 [Stellaceae bacterium]|nr:hypothetical protein [Stellaceae bacterium]
MRQLAAAPFEIGGGDIVKQQRAVLQVAAGQLGFDKRLLAAEPVERGIDLLGGDTAEPQNLAQRMAGGGGIEHPRGRQLGLEQARERSGPAPDPSGVAAPGAAAPHRARCGAPDASPEILAEQLRRDTGKIDWVRIDAGGGPEDCLVAARHVLAAG